jgi:hypothetical protein
MSDLVPLAEIPGKLYALIMAHPQGEGPKEVSDLAMLVADLAAHVQALERRSAELTLEVAKTVRK